MFCLPMPKKLKQLPSSSKRAWKSFTSSLHHHPKLRDLHRHLNSATSTARRLLHLRPKRRPPFLSRPPRGSRTRLYYKKQFKYQYQYQHLQQGSMPNSPATVYVDRLFGDQPSSSSKAKAKTPRAPPASRADASASGGRKCDGTKSCVKREKVEKNNENSNGVKWKEYVSSLPTIRGVDERAEEFISKFRQQMQLQREQSIVEFQQMLARTA